MLALTLYSLLRQSETDFEVVIADDGSREDTWKLIERFQNLFGKRLSHQWQEDHGARRARILNRALDVSKASRIVVIEENSFVHRHFVRDHLAMASKCDLFLGARVMLSPDLSDLIVENPSKIDTLEFRRRTFFAARSRKLDGFNMSFGKSWLTTVEGFDESLTKANDDIADFYARMQQAGASIRTSQQQAVEWCLQDYLRPSAELRME